MTRKTHTSRGVAAFAGYVGIGGLKQRARSAAFGKREEGVVTVTHEAMARCLPEWKRNNKKETL